MASARVTFRTPIVCVVHEEGTVGGMGPALCIRRPCIFVTSSEGVAIPSIPMGRWGPLSNPFLPRIFVVPYILSWSQSLIDGDLGRIMMTSGHELSLPPGHVSHPGVWPVLDLVHSCMVERGVEMMRTEPINMRPIITIPYKSYARA